MTLRTLVSRLLDTVTGSGSGPERGVPTLELRREVVREVTTRALEFSERPFPYGRVRVLVRAPEADVRQRYEAALVEEAPLADAVRLAMKNARLQPRPDLQVETEFVEAWPEAASAGEGERVAVVFEGRPSPAAPREVSRQAAPEASGAPALALRVVAGRAARDVVPLAGEAVRIGRGASHRLRSGQTRTNDLAFLDPHDANDLPDDARALNERVGRAHAAVRFDAGAGAWRLVPEGGAVTHVRGEARLLVRNAHQGVFLREGDRLDLGGAAVEVVASGAAPEAGAGVTRSGDGH